MTAPTTEAGRALLDTHRNPGGDWYYVTLESLTARILAIEAEARAQAEAQIATLERVGAAAARWQGASDAWKQRATTAEAQLLALREALAELERAASEYANSTHGISGDTE